MLFVLSVAAQVAWAAVDANHAYYGTEARLYQLIAGVAARAGVPQRGRPRSPGARSASAPSCPPPAWCGRRLLARRTPSVRGLLATVFAVGLVASLAAQSGGLPERFFSLPPLVFLGKISYGTYLWHWPVVILLREVVEPGVVARTLLVVVLSTALATASYQMLERPVRSVKLRELFRGPTVMIALTASALVAVLAVPPVLEKDGRPALALSGSGGVATGTAEERHRSGARHRLRLLRRGQGRHRAVLQGRRPRALRGGHRQPRSPRWCWPATATPRCSCRR